MISEYDLYELNESRPVILVNNIEEKAGDWIVNTVDKFFHYNNKIYNCTTEEGFDPEENFYFRLQENGIIEIRIVL